MRKLDKIFIYNPLMNEKISKDDKKGAMKTYNNIQKEMLESVNVEEMQQNIEGVL